MHIVAMTALTFGGDAEALGRSARLVMANQRPSAGIGAPVASPQIRNPRAGFAPQPWETQTSNRQVEY